jgi:uncharacterized protein DUF4276
VNIGLIVEGHGEREAVPLLLRRIAHWLDPALALNIVPPLRIAKGQIMKEPELKRAVELVARKSGNGAPILILLDADDDAACLLAPQLIRWAKEARPDREISVVVAVREYEAWFLAAARSLAGKRGLPADIEPPDEPERRASPKRWLDERMPSGYSETLDQPALTALMSLEEARQADSLDKLVRDIARLLGRSAPARTL